MCYDLIFNTCIADIENEVSRKAHVVFLKFLCLLYLKAHKHIMTIDTLSVLIKFSGIPFSTNPAFL